MNATRRLVPWILALALVAGTYVPPASADLDIDVSFGFFHQNLSSHGNWFVSANYGRVWQPNIYQVGWNPYHDGHWVYTDVGWTWVSDYRWGSIPYHYGTWTLDPRLGWVWVPGQVWAPSWVVFRTGPGYVGWAPVPVGFSLNASFTFGNDGYYDDYGYGYDYDPNMFIFVGDRDFLAPRIRERVVPVYRVRTILPRTTVLNTVRIENNIVINTGPDVRTIERSTGVRVQQQPIERVQRVAPQGTRVRRESLRVDTTRASGPIRATAPVDQPRAQGLPPGARERRSIPPPDQRTQPPRPAPDETSPTPQRIEPGRRVPPEPEPQPQPRSKQPQPPDQDRIEPGRRVPPEPEPSPRPQAKAKQPQPPPPELEPSPRPQAKAKQPLPPAPEPSPRPQAKAKQPPAPTPREQALPPAQPTPLPDPDSAAAAKAKEEERQKAKAKKKAPPKKKAKDDEDKDEDPPPTS